MKLRKIFSLKTIFLLLSFLILVSVNYRLQAQFANGADIGWLSEMEASGYKFYNDSGIQKNCMEILQEEGINSLRFRVWVNPTDGWCNKKDVAYMAQRADSMGFRVMIDFHYSDWWADPGKQNKPAAWASHTVGELLTDIYSHTYEVLDTLKTLDITPEWVQIGNETNNGMLWPEGKASTSMGNFASMVSSGYDAVKAVDSTIKVIVHISNGYNNSLFRWMFDGLKNNGARWDIIGMSLYPSWAGTTWQTANTNCLKNMNDMVTRYQKEVMICEVGMASNLEYDCNAFLLDLISKTKSVTGGLGVFYWEPQAYSWKSYTLGAWSAVTKQPTLALDAFLGISHLKPVDIKSISDNSGIIIYPNPSLDGKINFKLPGISGQSLVKIMDINGRIITKIEINQDSEYHSVPNLLPGIYFMQLDNKNNKSVKSFVVE